MTEIMIDKKRRLEEYLLSLGGVFTAYSAGVDSTFLLKVAHDVLGDNAAAVTASSVFFPKEELETAKEFCRSHNIRHIVIEHDPLSDESIVQNPPDRCYICKKSLFTRMRALADESGVEHTIDGTNADDDKDYRPGQRALSELGIKSPLREVGLTKAEIRQLSEEMGLETWDKPALACLATRIPTGDRLTVEKLYMAGDAERYIRSLGFSQLRVRVHGNIARIETETVDIPRMTEPETADKINRTLKGMGFRFVTLDLGGYRMGSMN